MRYPFVLFFLMIFSVSHSQQRGEEEVINHLKEEISKNEGVKKLLLLDSLSNVIAYGSNFDNDSIVKETIQYAKKLDSANVVVWHAANLIYFENNKNSDPKSGIAVFLENQKWASKVSNREILGKYYYEAGNSYFYLNEFDKSLQFLDSAYHYAQLDADYKFMGLSRQVQGQVYTDMGDFGKASLTFQEALKMFQNEKDTANIVGVRNSLTILYSKNGFYEEARKEREEIIALEKIRKSYNYLPIIYYNAAADYSKLGLQNERIQSLKSSIEFAKLSDYAYYYEPIMLLGLIGAYAENDSIAEAEKLLIAIIENSEKNTTGLYRPYYLTAIKNLAFAKKNYTEAIRFGKEYLELKKQGDQYEERQNGERFLYKVYKAIGENDLALTHFENYRAIKDTVEAAQKVRVLSYYQTLYETEKRDLTISAQKSDIALLDEKNKVKNQWLLFGGLGALVLFGFVYVIRSRNFARRKQKMQASFTQDLLKTQENERSRIATELHDSIGQKLLIIKNSLISREEKEAKEIDLVGETIKEVREMSHNLHPFQFEKLGLTTSLKNMIETFQKNSNVFYSEAIKTQDGLIPKEKEIYVFRMLQEALTNVEKHAKATACNLSSEEKKKELIFTLKDNGKGFEMPKDTAEFQGLGMKTLQERAQFINADLTIKSIPEKGTTITIKIPKK